MSILILGPGIIDERNTRILRSRKKLPARNDGSLGSAIESAGHHARKLKKTMFVYLGNSYMHIVHRVSHRPGDYLNPIDNTGSVVYSITPELILSEHSVERRG